MTPANTANGAPMAFRDLPGPVGLPGLGNLHRVRLDRLHLGLEEWAERYGPIYRIRLGPKGIAVISDRATAQQVLRQRPDGFRRTRTIAATADEMGLNGVFAAEGDDWRRQRRIVVAALNRAKLDDFFPKLAVTVGRLQRRWERAADRGETIDPCRDLMRFTVDVTVQLAFGIDANTLETPGPAIQQHLDKVFPVLHRRVNFPFPYWRYFRLPSDRALDRALAELQREVGAMVRAARQRLATEPERRRAPTDFLEAILAALEDEDSGFSDAEIFANAGTLLLAGEDTTANSLAWILHYFTRFPEHFARARREVDERIAPAPAIEALDRTQDFPFLDAFRDEVMRLKPVAAFSVAEPNADVELLGCLIPRGTPLFLLTRHIAVQDGHFHRGDRFDPERWLARTETASGPRSAAGACPHDTRAFLPFGSGPRVCPGRGLALLQIRTVLAMVCRNFDLEPASARAGVEEHLAFTMMPANLSLRLKRRPAA